MLINLFEAIVKLVWKITKKFFVLLWKGIPRLVTLLVFVPPLYYFCREVSHDVVIIDSFSIPKQFEEAGFTPDVVTNRIGNTMQGIAEDAHAQTEKNEVTLQRDEPDVEVPGTKLGLKTLTEMYRAIPWWAHKATHVAGDVVAQSNSGPSAEKFLTVTIFLKDQQGTRPPIRFVSKANDIDSLTREIAEKTWEQVTPLVLASYQYEHHDLDDALKLARQIVAEEPPENGQVAASYALIGKILADQHDCKEAVANFRESIKINSKSAFPYVVWGNALASQRNDLAEQGNALAAKKKSDEAVALYKKAIGINPKSAAAYNGWGNTLRYEQNYKEADAMYQKAIKIDPKFVQAHNNRALLFYRQDNYPQAIEQFQQANAIDSRHTNHRWWAKVWFDEKKYDEAISQYKKAVELEPTAFNGYNGWGDALAAEHKYDEAIEQYQKALGVDPKSAEAYAGWGRALLAQGKQKAAQEKLATAEHLKKAEKLAEDERLAKTSDCD
jgi:tetratricopeptide (TPR) repeat protein